MAANLEHHQDKDSGVDSDEERELIVVAKETNPEEEVAMEEGIAATDEDHAMEKSRLMKGIILSCVILNFMAGNSTILCSGIFMEGWKTSFQTSTSTIAGGLAAQIAAWHAFSPLAR